MVDRGIETIYSSFPMQDSMVDRFTTCCASARQCNFGLFVQLVKIVEGSGNNKLCGIPANHEVQAAATS